MTTRHDVLIILGLGVIVGLAIGLILCGTGHAGEFYLSGSMGVTSFIRTVDDGTWIQRGLTHNFHSQNVGWRTGAGYRINPAWSVQAHYINLGTVRIETMAVGDESYDPKANRCLSHCDKAIPFHTHDLMEGAEISVSRHWQVGPIDPFLRAGGAAIYHRLTAQYGNVSMVGYDGKAFNGWIPTALVGGGLCYRWVCGETTYYYGFGGGTDWSAGLPISKQSVQTLLTVNIPLTSW